MLLYPMFFLSGMAFPRELLPERLREMTSVLPATPVVTLLREGWTGHAWWSEFHATALAVLGIGLGSALLAALRFSWE